MVMVQQFVWGEVETLKSPPCFDPIHPLFLAVAAEPRSSALTNAPNLSL